MAAIDWRQLAGLELRYDGPIPAWEWSVPPAAVTLLQRMRLHRRLALEYAQSARRQLDFAAIDDGNGQRSVHRQAAERSRRNLAEARQTHSSLAATLGALSRDTAAAICRREDRPGWGRPSLGAPVPPDG